MEKNVCLTVTRFAYSTMSWEGRLTGGKIKLCVYSEPSAQLRFPGQFASLAAAGPDFTSLPGHSSTHRLQRFLDHCPHALNFSLCHPVPEASPATSMCLQAAFFFLFGHPTYQWRESWQTVFLCGSQILSGGESAGRETVGKQRFSGEVDGTRGRAEPSCLFYLLMAWGLSKMEQHLKTCDLAQNTHCSNRKTETNKWK